MTSFDVLTFGSITIDIILPLKEEPSLSIEQDLLNIKLGEKIQTKNSCMQCGGGAANTAIGFSKMGFKPCIFGVLGDRSYKGFLIDTLKKFGIHTDFIVYAKNQTSSFSVVLNTWRGERTVFHRRVSSDDFNAQSMLNAPSAKLLYLGHLYHNDIVLSVPEWKQKNPQSLIGWNPGKTQFKEGLENFSPMMSCIDYLFINREESEHFTSIKAKSYPYEDFKTSLFGAMIENYDFHTPEAIYDMREVAQKFLDKGIKNVVITDGKSGAQYFSHKDHFFAPAKEVKVIDTLGAGDAFSVGMLSAVLKGKSVEEQIFLASENSASVIQCLGGIEGQLKA